MDRHYQLRVQWGMDTYFVDPYTAWQHRNKRTSKRSEPTLPTHTPTSEPSPRKNCRRSSPRSTTNPENTSTRQHHQKPTNTTHNHTTTVTHLRLEQGVPIPVSVSMLSLSVAGITGGVHPENSSVTCEPNLLARNKSWQMQKC